MIGIDKTTNEQMEQADHRMLVIFMEKTPQRSITDIAL